MYMYTNKAKIAENYARAAAAAAAVYTADFTAATYIEILCITIK